MSTFVIPTFPGESFYEEECILEGVTYRLTFRYNQRENCFYVSIGDPDDTTGADLVSSIKLVTNKPLIARWSGAASANGSIWPPGEMVAVSLTNSDAIAGLNDLGNTVLLLYVTSDDAMLQGP